MAATEATRAIASVAPMTLYCNDGFHFRERDGRVILSSPTPGNVDDPFDGSVEPSWLDEVARKKDARIPVLRGVRWTLPRRGGAVRDVPRQARHLGPAESRSNFFLVNGSSGHGVMHAPALGQLAAEIILDGKAATLDATPLVPNRFRIGQVDRLAGGAVMFELMVAAKLFLTTPRDNVGINRAELEARFGHPLGSAPTTFRARRPRGRRTTSSRSNGRSSAFASTCPRRRTWSRCSA